MKNNNKKRVKRAAKQGGAFSGNGQKVTYVTEAMKEKLIAKFRKTRERLWREKIGLGS